MSPATLRNPSGNAKIYVAPWIYRPEGINAMASVVYLRLKGRPARLFARSISLVTRFSEIAQLETSNLGTPPALVRMPLRQYIQLPQLASLPELLAAHQLLVGRFHPGNERLLPEMGQELAMLSRKMMETYRYQAEAGRLTLVGPKIYRLTLFKGAVFNGRQFAWPIKSVRIWRLKRRAQKMVASLETSSG